MVVVAVNKRRLVESNSPFRKVTRYEVFLNDGSGKAQVLINGTWLNYSRKDTLNHEEVSALLISFGKSLKEFL